MERFIVAGETVTQENISFLFRKIIELNKSKPDYQATGSAIPNDDLWKYL